MPRTISEPKENIREQVRVCKSLLGKFKIRLEKMHGINFGAFSKSAVILGRDNKSL